RAPRPGGGGAGLGPRPRLPPLPRHGRARGLGQDPARRADALRAGPPTPPRGGAAPLVAVDGTRRRLADGAAPGGRPGGGPSASAAPRRAGRRSRRGGRRRGARARLGAGQRAPDRPARSRDEHGAAEPRPGRPTGSEKDDPALAAAPAGDPSDTVHVNEDDDRDAPQGGLNDAPHE